MQINRILEEIGLTKSEILVYLALIDIGESTTGPIIKKAGIAAGKAYIIMDKLLQKGLVTHVIKENIKYYHAADPERILDYFEDKEKEIKKKKEELNKIIPSLKERYNRLNYTSKAEVYEGIKGFKTLYEQILKELEGGDEIKVVGVSREVHDILEAYLLDWNKRRVKKGIKMKIIYSHKDRKIGEKREKMRLTEVKYMKEELQTPAWIDIFKDYVVTINVHETPIAFLIKNKESAESYNVYFEILWKQSES